MIGWSRHMELEVGIGIMSTLVGSLFAHELVTWQDE